MIKIYLDLNHKLNEKAQKNICKFINFFVDGLKEAISQEDEDDYYEIIFPRFIVRKNKELCKNVIMDLYDWSKDSYTHTLKPLYEYAFFYILNYCREIDEDIYKERKESLFNMKYDLKDDVDDLELEIDTFSFYEAYCFLDIDFLDVSAMYELYKKSPLLVDYMNVELDDYIDLMPYDIADEYKQRKKYYDEEIKKLKEQTMEKDKKPTVFISYSWDSDEHIRWVLRLASTLREKGVNAIVDQVEIQQETLNLNSMMLKNMQKSDFILVIMTENYAHRANNEIGGVGFETNSLVNYTRENISKIIPILRGDSDKSIPFYLKGISYIDLSNEKNFRDNFKNLLYRIYQQDMIKLSPIGEKPNFKTEKIEPFDI